MSDQNDETAADKVSYFANSWIGDLLSSCLLNGCMALTVPCILLPVGFAFFFR